MSLPPITDTIKVRGVPIAVEKTKGKNPGIMWLGGYTSDMFGTKACTIAQWAHQNNLSFLRYDYSGHGKSGGEFTEGTISRWLEESLTVFNHYTKGPQILAASSMGAWIALRMAQELEKEKKENLLAGLILIAPAPDFTKDLVEPFLTSEDRLILEKEGLIKLSSFSGSSYRYTRSFLEDGLANLVLTQPFKIDCPIHIIHGTCDTDVPLSHALKLITFLPKENLSVTFVPEGDHRLSNPSDLNIILSSLQKIVENYSF